MTTSIELLASSKPIVEEEQLRKGYLVQYELIAPGARTIQTIHKNAYVLLGIEKP